MRPVRIHLPHFGIKERRDAGQAHNCAAVRDSRIDPREIGSRDRAAGATVPSVVEFVSAASVELFTMETVTYSHGTL